MGALARRYSSAMQTRPVFQVAVIMRREQLDNRWQPWRWVLEDVVPQEPAFGAAPRLLRQTDEVAQWLQAVVSLPLPGVGASLQSLPHLLPEMEFWLPAGRLQAQTIDALFAPLPVVESRGRAWTFTGGQLKPLQLRLGISDGTVKIYVRSLLQKLGLHSRLELAAWVHSGALMKHEERH